MSPHPASGLLSSEEAASRRQVRRYAVPRTMIETSAARRAAGDWRGALAAAGYDLELDPARLSARYGTAVAAAVEDDLRHLVPDLLRWHLPRILGGRSTLATEQTLLLAGYGPTDGERDGAPYLILRTGAMVDGPQRVALRFGPARHRGSGAPDVEDWRTLRHLWDARRTAELRERAGGGTRLPFLDADGTPLPADRLPHDAPDGTDPVARAEWATLLHQRGDIAGSLEAAGIVWDATPPEMPAWYRSTPETLIRTVALDVPRLEAEVHRVAALTGAERFQISRDWRVRVLLDFTGPGHEGRLRVRLVEREAAEGAAPLPETVWRRLPDLDLLRTGDLTARQLHPLVAAALFPGLDGPFGPDGPTAPGPVRVRCRGVWHTVRFRDGVLDSPHTPQERQREHALRAFGGAVTGCFAAEHASTSGTGRLPRALAAQRRDLFLHAEHGNTEAVTALLDAGFDPRIRDGGRRTLLHLLPQLDHTALLPRLLDAGLDLEARDHRERTPLSTAVSGRGSAALVRALLDAGARPDVVDQTELSLDQVIRKYRRTDLRFLAERVAEEFPDLGAEWWEEWDPDEDDLDDLDDDGPDEDDGAGTDEEEGEHG
ncbi:ankyrin repeat domain-containing protein [Streptomyces sp. NPDC057682]|uniref:ankyrin repeat domain-containing protein n=1 Tax=Streptomyces sp. NPDC057682 TaxID=3346210 RepID=UPI0036B27840